MYPWLNQHKPTTVTQQMVKQFLNERNKLRGNQFIIYGSSIRLSQKENGGIIGVERPTFKIGSISKWYKSFWW